MRNKDRTWLMTGAVLLFALMMLSFASCRTQKQVTDNVQYIHLTDTLRVVSLRVDSVIERDSIVTLIKGDTVRIERWRDRWYRSADTVTVVRWKVKTLYRTKTVTITPPPVKAPLSWWQKVLMWAGGLALFGCAIVALMAVRKWKI